MDETETNPVVDMEVDTKGRGKKMSKNKKMAIILLVLAILGLITGVLVWYFFFRGADKSESGSGLSKSPNTSKSTAKSDASSTPTPPPNNPAPPTSPTSVPAATTTTTVPPPYMPPSQPATPQATAPPPDSPPVFPTVSPNAPPDPQANTAGTPPSPTTPSTSPYGYTPYLPPTAPQVPSPTPATPILLGSWGEALAQTRALTMKSVSNTAMAVAPITDANRGNARPGVCDAECYGHPGATDKFEIFLVANKYIGARRMDADAPWGLPLQITQAPRTPTAEEESMLQFWDTKVLNFGPYGSPVNGTGVLEMKQLSNTKMLFAPITDSNRGFAVAGVCDGATRGDNATDKFEIFTLLNGYVAARRLDADAPWGLHLRLLRAPRAPTDAERTAMKFWEDRSPTGGSSTQVLFGSYGEAIAEERVFNVGGVWMPWARITEANKALAVPGICDGTTRGDGDPDVFEIFVIAKGYLGARRIDAVDAPWGLSLRLLQTPRTPTADELPKLLYANPPIPGNHPIVIGSSSNAESEGRVFTLDGMSMHYALITDLNKDLAMPGIVDAGIHGVHGNTDKFEAFIVAKGHLAVRRIDAPGNPWGMNLRILFPPRPPRDEEISQMKYWVS